MIYPGIRLARDTDSKQWTLSQRRPKVARTLAGLAIDDALGRIPLLLPLCATAQLTAARMAVGAVRGDSVDRTSLATLLLREQGLAHAWRWLITWPPLLGEAKRADKLRGLRSANSNMALSELLAVCVPGLQAVKNFSELATWANARESLPARWMSQLLTMHGGGATRSSSSVHSEPETFPPMIDQSAISQLIYTGLLDESSDDAIIFKAVTAGVPEETVLSGGNASGAKTRLAPSFYVGPLAAQQQVFDEDLRARNCFGLLGNLFAAQLFDGIAVMSALASEPDVTAISDPRLAVLADETRVGIGSAMTSRGPVFHVVYQAVEDYGRGIISEWQIIAPTDWHFANGQLLRHLLREDNSENLAAMALSALDPCCAATVELGER